MLVYYVLIYAGLRSLLTSPGVYTMPMEHDDGVNDAPGLPLPDLPEGSDIDKSKRILKIMKTKGRVYTDAIELVADENITQYLVVTVLSYTEFQQNDFESSNAVPDNRTEVVLNLNMTGLPSYFGFNKVHGEILTLYINNTIDEFLQLLDVHEAGPMSNLPYVFVYSHYIPCAGLVGYNYSCAEEIANAGRVNRNRYRLIVGYSTKYFRTNVPLATQYLTEGGITYLINITSGAVPRNTNNFNPETYQENMFKCLRDQQIRNLAERDAAFIVNQVIKQCTINSTRHGYITQFGKYELYDCVEKCTCINYNLELLYCSAQTLADKFRLMLGEPIDMCTAKWKDTPDNLQWSKLYEGMTGTHSLELINLRTKEMNDKLTKLCTQETQKKDRMPKFLRKEFTRIQDDVNKNRRDRPGLESQSICPLHGL